VGHLVPNPGQDQFVWSSPPTGGGLSHHVVLPKKTAPLPSQRGRPQSQPPCSANGEAVDIFADIDSQGTHV